MSTHTFFAIILSLCICSCSSDKLNLGLVSLTISKDSPTTTINIETSKNTNYGVPFYAVVQELDDENDQENDIKVIATSIFDKDTKLQNLESQIIYPGQTTTIKINTSSSQKKLAVYFLLEKASFKNCKVFLNDPNNKEYLFSLDEDSISSYQEKQSSS
jgi:hypothetical protein